MILDKYKYILFDLDDTLLDFEKAEHIAFNKLLEDSDIQFNEELFNKYKEINKALWRRFELGEMSNKEVTKLRFEQFFSLLGKKVDGREYDVSFRSYLAMGNQLFDGVVELLDKLSKTHVMCIASNGVGVTQHNDLNKYFEHIFISEEVGYQKPDVEFFNFIFQKLGDIDKKEVIIVGDNLMSDILGGINSGIDTCWINPKNSPVDNEVKPTYIVKKVTDLLQ